MSLPVIYAKALYMAAKEQNVVDDVDQNFNSFVEIFENVTDVKKILCGPLAATSEKRAVIENVAKKLQVNTEFKNFLLLLNKKRRMAIVSKIHKAFRRVRCEGEGKEYGHVVSAQPLSSAELSRLSETMAKKFGRPMEFEVEHDPRLIAGMKVVVGGTTYDGSVQTKLKKMRDAVSIQ